MKKLMLAITCMIAIVFLAPMAYLTAVLTYLVNVLAAKADKPIFDDVGREEIRKIVRHPIQWLESQE